MHVCLVRGWLNNHTGPILFPSYPLTYINIHDKYGCTPIRIFLVEIQNIICLKFWGVLGDICRIQGYQNFKAKDLITENTYVQQGQALRINGPQHSIFVTDTFIEFPML